MKKSNLIFNVFVVIALAVLYYLHFSCRPCNDESCTGATDSTGTTPKMQASMPKEIKASKIVYVNADSLFGNYLYVKELKKETEIKQTRIESVYQSKAKKLQDDYVALQNKAQQGLLSQEEGKNAEESLMRRKGELEQMEKQLGELADETQKKNIIVQKNITDYLKEYNKNSHYNFILAYTSAAGSVLLANDSLDITAEILQGINEQYKNSKTNLPAKK